MWVGGWLCGGGSGGGVERLLGKEGVGGGRGWVEVEGGW